MVTSGPAADKAAHDLLRVPTLADYRAALAQGEFSGAVGVHYATMPGELTLDVDGVTRHLHAVGVPALAGANPHVHWHSSEHWRVVDGELSAWLGTVVADKRRVEWGERLWLQTGEGLFVPAAGAHTLRNVSTDKPVIVAILCEKSHMDGTDRTFFGDGWAGAEPFGW